MTENQYDQEIQLWRTEREHSLRKDQGWLALDGLFWLQEGSNQVGVDPASDVVLSQGPGHAGTLEVSHKRVRWRTSPANRVLIEGHPISEAELRPDGDEDPSLIEIANLRLMILRRGDRYAVRIWNPDRPERQSFPGRIWYSVDPSYKVTAEYNPAASDRKILLPDYTGHSQELPVAGLLHFELQRHDCKLIALEESQAELFILFTDPTRESDTYPGGRYLYAPVNGSQAILDFNKAYNPPCAFTRFATCPLPPPDNHLPIPVLAGERYSGSLGG